MHDQPSQPSEAERRDKRNQRALLSLALCEFPTHLQKRNLGWQIASGEALERAIVELVTAGLLFCEGEEILPTLPARHFDWLELS